MAAFTSARKNPYKHLSAREGTLLTHLPPSSTATIAASDAFYAVPYRSGGGGPVYIGKLDEKAKVEPVEALSKCVLGHKAAVHAVAFSPFHSAFLATGGEDCRVRVAPNVGDPAKESLEVGAHGSGVRCLQFHPAAEHVLLSAAADGGWATWDAEARARVHGGALDAAITHIDWTRSFFAASCRDRTLRCVDVRTGAVAWSAVPHGGARAFRAVFSSEHTVLSVGSASSGGREVALLDTRKPDAIAARATIDAQSGDVLSHWDEDASILWCVGRGDRVVRRFECTSLSVTQGATWRSEQAASMAFCALPHKLRDVMDLEVFKCLRLTDTTVDTADFRVVRTQDHKAFFNDDIYRETRSRFPSTTASRWASGESPPSLTESCQPLGTPLLSERVVEKKVLNTVVVNDCRASVKEDKAQDDAALDRLAQLADQFTSANVNLSMGNRVDAQVVDTGDVDSDEWDDSD